MSATEAAVLQGRIDVLEERISSVDGKVDDLKGTVAGLDGKVDGIKTQLEVLKTERHNDNAWLRDKIETMDARYAKSQQPVPSPAPSPVPSEAAPSELDVIYRKVRAVFWIAIMLLVILICIEAIDKMSHLNVGKLVEHTP
jgi:hypothetical protein